MEVEWPSLEPLLLVSECTLQAVLKFKANDRGGREREGES